MTPERLSRILAAYGANADRWPAAERDAALRLLTDDPEAMRFMREEQWLDALLSRHVVPAPHAALVGSVLVGFAPPSGLSVLRSWWTRFALAGAALAGVAVGVLTLDVMHARSSGRQAMTLADDQETIFTPLDTDEASL
ncbi:hypothetical protein [Novosphingobium kaempferiae]|uniref:hypothetical protein n=1 Tax=Novosphingobium kaempferiae TaxID=2896849 RepID=UPI001E33E4C0|nr:hypothetical protein [Novosphingobium kaempferiae]